MTYKCKICGGQATVDSNNGIVVCDYCGTKQALPLFSDESEKLLYESGNNYLLHSEYDKAENVFNQLLTIKPGAAELYWDLVLCKYGVTYVKDPKTGKYIPTCNRTHYTPIFFDENYKKAIELSSGDKKALFEEDAKTIDDIQKGIIAVSKKEKPFDIFISYKETDANGQRTEDSIVAQDLYEKLTEAGYKVFFSRITLEDKIGTEYEPYIYAALHSSKVMLTICSSKENLEAVWVKNEWSRFLTLRQQDSEKTLIPLYFNMEKSDLPEEFAILLAQDMQKEGFEQDLIRGIKKLIPKSVIRAQRQKQLFKMFGISAALICVITLAAAAIFLPGYLKENQYIYAKQLFEEAEYDSAYTAFSELKDYKDSENMAYRSMAQKNYDKAINLFEQKEYERAYSLFKELKDYQDSENMAYRCTLQPDYDAAMQLFENGNYAEAACAFAQLGDYEDSAQMKEQAETTQYESEKTQEYNAAMQLYYDGNYAGAAWAFKALADFKDSSDMQKKAERAWRDKLATVSVTVSGIESNLGTYYISANGEVKCSLDDPGAAHEGIEINSHGKIVSIAGDVDSLYALYEDGYVYNSAKNNGMDADWEDIIQITPEDIGVALKNDGTVVCGNDWRDWLSPVSTWKDIVSLSYSTRRISEGFFHAILVGIDINGDVYSVSYLYSKYNEGTGLSAEVDKLNSLKGAQKVITRTSTDYGYKVSFAALDSENNLIYYKNGTTDIREKTQYTDIIFKFDDNYVMCLMALDNKGTVYDLDKGTIVTEDVVYIDPEGNFVKQSGTIEGTDIKTGVRDIWLEGKN